MNIIPYSFVGYDASFDVQHEINVMLSDVRMSRLNLRQEKFTILCNCCDCAAIKQF